MIPTESNICTFAGARSPVTSSVPWQDRIGVPALQPAIWLPIAQESHTMTEAITGSCQTEQEGALSRVRMGCTLQRQALDN